MGAFRPKSCQIPKEPNNIRIIGNLSPASMNAVQYLWPFFMNYPWTLLNKRLRMSDTRKGRMLNKRLLQIPCQDVSLRWFNGNLHNFPLFQHIANAEVGQTFLSSIMFIELLVVYLLSAFRGKLIFHRNLDLFFFRYCIVVHSRILSLSLFSGSALSLSQLKYLFF